MISQNRMSFSFSRGRDFLDGITIGVVLSIRGGVSKVVFPGNLSESAIPAISTITMDKSDIGSEVALAFENGDPRKPIILGKIQRPQEPVAEPPEKSIELPVDVPLEIEADGERVEVEADREIVLRCGKASITMTKAGKIILRGTYISSRSSGMNRVSGASINLN